MFKKAFINGFICSLTIATAICGTENKSELGKYGVDKTMFIDGQYRGRFTPDADYVLDGHLRKDFEKDLPKVPWKFLSEKDGFSMANISKVPEAGVHPRVLMSPEDITRIRAELAKGDKASRYFRIVWQDMKEGVQFTKTISVPALVALVEDDHEAGRKLAKELVEYALYVEPAIEIMDTHDDIKEWRENWYYFVRMYVDKVGGEYYRDVYNRGGAELIRKLAKEKGAEVATTGDSHKNPALGSGSLFNTDLAAYDYLAPFMTNEEKAIVRRVIAKATRNRYTTGMELPKNLFINNHMSMGEDLLVTHLAIEGEEGYDPRLLKEYSEAVLGKLTYDISPAGLLHEKCKGFLPERASIAITRRSINPETGAMPLLAHDHLYEMVMAKVMDSVNLFYIPDYKLPDIGKLNPASRIWWQGYGSGPWMDQFFNWAFVMKFVYPNDPLVDYFYKERLSNGELYNLPANFGSVNDPVSVKLPKPRIRYTWRDVMLLTVTDGLKDEHGVAIDYNKSGLPKDLTDKKEAFVDMVRGVAVARSSWDKDALTLHYECRSDVLSSGHETPEAGDFNLSSDGIAWSMRRIWYLDSYFRNTILIDGKAGVYSPVAAKLMNVEDNDISSTFISDLTDQYNWRKREKNFYSWCGMVSQNKFEAQIYAGGRWQRNWEVPFQEQMRTYQENLTGLDWGNWHGETRGPEMFEQWNDVNHVFRTMHLVKGENPYVLVVDDVLKDNDTHQYDWIMHLENDITLFDSTSSVAGRWLEATMPKDRYTDIVLCTEDVPSKRFQRYGVQTTKNAKKGDPLLLVRVLWRNTNAPFPQPSFEKGYLVPRIKIPALTNGDPQFRVLLFPYRHGEAKPLTWWNEDNSKLFVSIKGEVDEYTFGTTERGRSIFTMSRQGKVCGGTVDAPAMPELDTIYGYTPDRNFTESPRKIVVGKNGVITLKAATDGTDIRYTIDGSEPNENSPKYKKPVNVENTKIFKAKTFARYWPFGENNNVSESLVLTVEKQAKQPAKLFNFGGKSGLNCEVYDIHQTIFDPETGIFTGKTKMLPNLDEYTPILSCRLLGLEIPEIAPKSLPYDMNMGFYRYTGKIAVDENGVHGFSFNSCGPVVLKIGKEKVINVTGVYGLSQKTRFGEINLAKGKHDFELIVCDPVFWKNGREGLYEIELKVATPTSKEYVEVTNDMFSCNKNLPLMKKAELKEMPAINVDKDTTSGFIVNAYDRNFFNHVKQDNEEKVQRVVSKLAIPTERTIPYNGLAEEYFVTKDIKPYKVTGATAIEASDNVTRLLDYQGYFIADESGIYEFELDTDGGNLLTIDDVEVVGNRISNKKLSGKINLAEGMHKFSLKLAQSQAICNVKFPSSDKFVKLTTGMVARDSDIEDYGDSRLIISIDGNYLKDNMLTLDNSIVQARANNAKLVDNGKNGKGIQFVGASNSMLELFSLPTPEDALTVATWIRIDNLKSGTLIGGTWQSHPEGVIQGTRVKANYFRGSDFVWADFAKFGGKEQKWIHLAVTFSKLDVKIYMNGELQSVGAKTVPDRNAYVFNLEMFTGLAITIDDFKIFNKALSADEVKSLVK